MVPAAKFPFKIRRYMFKNQLYPTLALNEIEHLEVSLTEDTTKVTAQ